MIDDSDEEGGAARQAKEDAAGFRQAPEKQKAGAQAVAGELSRPISVRREDQR